jgi:tRNA (guanine37-N1)-methyltransferase
MQFDIVTLFPKMFEGPLTESMLARAQDAGHVKVLVHNLRDWSDDPRHQKVDDRPFGGGAGMVIRPEPVYRALKSLKAVTKSKTKPLVILMSPQGKVLSQTLAVTLAKSKRVVLLCGHYEGFDERIMEWVDLEVSMGPYVLTGGEIPAMAVVDVVSRFVSGVVGDPESVKNDSFANGLLDYPHYTRPQEWRGRKVPEILLSGDHKKIATWRKEAALKQTKKKRPDLLNK